MSLKKSESIDKSSVPRHDPIVTIDGVIFCWMNKELMVLLEKRRKEPFKGQFAVPGGYIHTQTDKTLEMGRDRILLEKVGFLPDYMEQLESIGNLGRDPRGWSVSIIYMCILKQDNPVFENLPDHLELFPVKDVALPGGTVLAFDHQEVINLAHQRLASKVAYSSLPLMFMPKRFTIPMIVNLHTAIMGKVQNKMTLHKRYKKGNLIRQIPEELMSLSGKRITDVYESAIIEPEMFHSSIGGNGG